MKRNRLKYFFISCLFISSCFAEAKEHSFSFYDDYLSKGHLDSQFVCQELFPRMSPEEINNALRDIRRFTRSFIVKNFRVLDEHFLINILHIHGHIITFIENAWVVLKTKKIIVEKKKTVIPGAVRLTEYWGRLEHKGGLKLHCWKLYASAFDYLIVLLKAYLVFPCRRQNHLSELEHRWIYWLKKIEQKLDGNPVFGGYYHELVQLYAEIFHLWQDDFNSQRKFTRSLGKNNLFDRGIT